ncbi:Conserved_hypothetical protein [Hexamita inflata]|uniref:Uncharacterized protein n=1 Tax=Hexamita inflata TaxID=28002 RepID=A0AA86UND4_9EUKA|nr:Conserved hypothetical protein [Hexamita inflata]
MISFFPVLLALICAENFQPSADFKSCVCLDLLSANKSKCVKSCEEIGETSFAGRCVNAIGLKSAASNDDCVALYNQGSIWDGASGCKCDNANGYAGGPNNYCTNCWNKIQIVSQDQLSCVSCFDVFGTGNIFSQDEEYKCQCDASQGFAGQPSSYCTNCWAIGKEVQGTICVSCTGNQVLQEYQCKDCPVNTIPSQDMLTCVKAFMSNEECVAKFKIGSIWDGASGCKCDSANGYAGSPNSKCILCSEMNYLISSDLMKCVSCYELYGNGVAYSDGKCVCDTYQGFVGTSINSCTNCWTIQQIVSADSQHCVSCQDAITGSIFSAGEYKKCKCDISQGFVGDLYFGSICTNCWDQSKIISSDKQYCDSCLDKFGVGAIYSLKQCQCDTSKGFTGQPNSRCANCWGAAQEIQGTICVSCAGSKVLLDHQCQDCPENTVPSQDKLWCITPSSFMSNLDCLTQFNQGSIWDGGSACKCDSANGFAGHPNGFCTDCWRLSQVVSEYSCAPCVNSFVFNGRSCKNCSQSFMVMSQDKKQCVTCKAKYGEGSVYSKTDICECSKVEGYAGPLNSICTDCQLIGKIVDSATSTCRSCDATMNKIYQDGKCIKCSTGLVTSKEGNSCVTCGQKFGIGSIYNINAVGGCSCDSANGFATSSKNVSECINCLRSDAQDKSACSATCSIKETWDSVQKKCVCDVASGYGGVSGACSCDIDKGYAGIDICTKCWDQAKIATISGCQDCPANEVFAPNSLSQCSCDSSKGYSGLPGSCSCSQPGFALTLGVCQNCAQNNQVTSPSGCQACPEFEKINPSTKACVCDSSLGYTGVSGGCYCNFGVGLIQAIDNNGVKSCVCKSSNGHVLDAASPSVSCKCDASTGHAGQPGACFCDSSTGHFGYPGFCMCNFNLQFVGSAGSCKNCAALNAHASQFNGAYFCRCNGDSGYGSPDAGGTCRLCASGNSVVQVDGQGQFQCVACAATEKVVKNMCVGA